MTVISYLSATTLSKWSQDLIHYCNQNGALLHSEWSTIALRMEQTKILWPSDYKRVKWCHKITEHLLYALNYRGTASLYEHNIFK